MYITIANHFFKAHPNSPLTNLKNCMKAPALQSMNIDKNDPIHEIGSIQLSRDHFRGQERKRDHLAIDEKGMYQ